MGRSMTNRTKTTYFNFRRGLSPGKVVIFLGKGILCNKSCISPKGQSQPQTKRPVTAPTNIKKTCHVKSKFKIPAADDCLHCPNGTSAYSPWAGVAVQAGKANFFQVSPIYFSLEKSCKVTVCKQCPQVLHPVAFPFIYISFNQFQYTPYRYLWLFQTLWPSPPGKFPIPSLEDLLQLCRFQRKESEKGGSFYRLFQLSFHNDFPIFK